MAAFPRNRVQSTKHSDRQNLVLIRDVRSDQMTFRRLEGESTAARDGEFDDGGRMPLSTAALLPQVLLLPPVVVVTAAGGGLAFLGCSAVCLETAFVFRIAESSLPPLPPTPPESDSSGRI